jgi:CDP-diacylglycerol--glycerol-3-phosphate 3-phosphatidyltransferase
MASPSVNISEALPPRRRVTLPNWLTLARLAAAPLIYLAAAYGTNIMAVVVYLLAVGTDAIDGRIARRFNLTTAFGRAFDSTADKAAVLGALGGLAAQGSLPVALLYTFATREFIVFGLRSIRTPSGTTIAEINDTLGRVRFLVVHVGVAGCLAFDGQFAEISLSLIWVGVAVGVVASVYYVVRDRAALLEVMRASKATA